MKKLHSKTKAILPRFILAAFLSGMVSQAVTINVTDAPYSADSSGQSNASVSFRDALTAIVSGGGGTLIVPPGHYLFTSRATVDLKDKTVTIQGSGRKVCQLFSDNSHGLFYFNNTDKEYELTIHDISFVAARANAGKALIIANFSLSTNPSKNSLVMERVDIVQKPGVADSYFTMGVDAQRLQQPIFNDIYCVLAPKALMPSGDTTHGIRILNSNSPFFESIYAKFALTGIQIGNVRGTTTIVRGKSVGVQRGYWITCDSSATTAVQLVACHSGHNKIGVEIWDADSVDIDTYVPYPTNRETPSTSVRLFRCGDSEIKNSLFHYLHTNSVQDYKAIDLASSQGTVLIRNNMFSNQGTIYTPGEGVTFTNNMIYNSNYQR